MCGIVGFVDPGQVTPNPEQVIRRMRDTLTHRGPDDAGLVIQAPAYFGHRRLTIVDLSARGRQPFVIDGAVPGSQVVALANGEIYNHKTLRRVIASRFGSQDIPDSDCAVLPWMWRLAGPRMAEQLEGMYGLAVWDTATQSLFLARDIAGQKPLYYAPLPGGGVAFASEPKALLAHPLIGRDLDAVALRRYLTYDYVPGSSTVYQGIRRILPAGWLHWRAGAMRTGHHWHLPYGAERFRDPQTAQDALWNALGDAIETRLMADVPLGVFLSGGLDSTALVAAMAERVDPRSIQTFSIGFSSESFDESTHARTVAEHYGTQHHEERLSPEVMMDLVPEVVSILDEPFADASILPVYLLSRFTRRHVTVALGGEAGDELLLGYPTFFADGLARLASRIPRSLRDRVLMPLLDKMPTSGGYMSLEFKLRRFLSRLDLAPDHRHPAWIGGLHPSEHAQALMPCWIQDAQDEEVFADLERLGDEIRQFAPGSPRMDRLAWQYFRTYLGADVLTKVDRASMAHALEVRAPMLDPAFIAVSAKIPPHFKLQGNQTKVVLRQALAGRVPQHIVARPKQGFGVPVGQWLRGPLRGWMESILAPAKVAQGGILNPAWTQKLVSDHVDGRADHRKALWSVLVLELWRRGPYGPS